MTQKLLEVNNLKKYFDTKRGKLHAVDDVSFYIYKGETLGVVGESGCGKSTTGRTVLRLIEPTEGEIFFDGIDINSLSQEVMRKKRKEMQIVFQDPYSSLDSRRTVYESIEEPLRVNKIFNNRTDLSNRVFELMNTVGLAERLVNSYPHELDGGRRQRVGIARALALNPSFIVLDEPVSALDVSIQAQILNLMERLQDNLNLTYMFISHNLSVVRHISDRVAVMYLGKIVELASYKNIFINPQHPYTKALLSAVPLPRIDLKLDRIILEGDVPSPINPVPRCRFYGRCPERKEVCKGDLPELREIEAEHFVACHLI
ncbi:ATP-binding cassette domain-containing protein [Sedimentibacter hydroxybenzoicus DSM 7310]|uniref:ATP-binding cassette domain-containing protein n=1 Tax=Sedimentibacter hydroxybenzoicus DSM 7310 TaxID=1123245 RepID=A0A974BLC3_SEDHY|nr:oligopeptide/dipeptide ABC transporter ATP-binding protein [Sedimentibacter hydroxybenzoicus]NYB75288.1 ATP-binding cassette domain-containing protein [Sedimentibacter hydroxybenzoicus DSM 7310]